MPQALLTNPNLQLKADMKTFSRLAPFVFALWLGACAGGPSGRAPDAPPLQAVASVDVMRYKGLWYEIARYPNWFQRNCEGVTAEYGLTATSAISVTNTCRTGTKNGRPSVANGRANVIEGSNGARLAVNFAPIPLPRGQGNYWILYLDTDYQTALIGSPSGQYLWMLARTPQISREQRAALEAAATANGFRLDMLKDTIQP
jgi:apolipoprotein D and lipocalin family protein